VRTILILLATLAGTAHAAGTIFSTLISGDGQDYATAVASDAQGDVFVAGLTYSPHFPVTAGAYQTTFGQTCDAFVAKVGPDGKVIWATYLGGILDDFATGVALDGAGNVLVTGYTRSPDFPLVHPIQSNFTGFEGFVAKFDPTGSRLLYSTLLSGQGETGGAGIVADSAGNAYVAMSTLSATGYPGAQTWPDQPGIFVSKLTPQGRLVYSYFHPNGVAAGLALDAAGAVYVAASYPSLYSSSATQTFGTPGLGYAIVFKISPDGTQKLYETALGGSVEADAAAIAVESTGEVWVAGRTASADFPLVHPLENSLGARPLWKSTDGGTTWTPLDNLPFALPQMLVPDPQTPGTIYAATGDLGVLKSVNGGATWVQANAGIATTNVQVLAIDPADTQTLYAAAAPGYEKTASAVYKSTDGARTWAHVDTSPLPVNQIAVDGKNPANVYEVNFNISYTPVNIRKSSDAGATWNNLTFPASVQSLVVDPRTGALIAVSNQEVSGPNGVGVNMPPFFYRSVDGGASWLRNQSVTPTVLPGLVIDGSTNPSTVYDALSFRSQDGGVTWSPLAPSPASSNTSAVAVDPGGNLYAAIPNGMFVSSDHGQTWTAIGAPAYPNITSIVPAGSGTLYTIARNQTGTQAASLGIEEFTANYSTIESTTSGFVSKLSADGSTLEYSTYLRGHSAGEPYTLFASEPYLFETQNWISAIALDNAGNVVVAGGTRATDFPTANPAQAANAGLSDAFAATLSPDGGKLNYATYFGGSGDDGALAAAVDSNGNVILAGQTFSRDFPVSGGESQPFSYGNAFVVKLATGPPVISSVLNGASYQPGIEAGSWVMIKGANLANSTRVWRSSDFDGGNLPESLDGVRVTIDGRPAFVEYISPTQINVQAPSDSTAGTVNVVVDNNGAASLPAPVQLQPVAPAFFMYPGTNMVVASLLPDYSLLSVAAAAKPGDMVALWGTGFGATTPAVAAGTVVAGVPAAVTPPTVTVGGMPATVMSTVLTPGSAGLYQIAIQLPANLPSGALPVVASVRGMQTQAGVTILVGTP
jgi:uncharacterized protein (TIGR03437 family)